MDRPSVSAILLAAGESRRLGGVDTLTLTLGSVPLLRHTALALAGADLGEIVAVVGHEPERAKGLLKGLPIRIVADPQYRDGRLSSVYRGLAALERPCAGIMICLAGMPLMETGDLDRLMAAFRASPPGTVLVPTHQGQRGNPAILDTCHRRAILALGPSPGAARLTDLFPDRLRTLEMPNDRCLADLDAWEDRSRPGLGPIPEPIPGPVSEPPGLGVGGAPVVGRNAAPG
jgi:molybdenum cofactor cytidylyltransferase